MKLISTFNATSTIFIPPLTLPNHRTKNWYSCLCAHYEGI